MKNILAIIFCISLFSMVACDVHEFPQETNVQVPFLLHLDFTTELPLYKEIIHTRVDNSETKGFISNHNIRYTIKVYRNDLARNNSREADTTFVFTKSDVSDLNFTAPLQLPEGSYDFQIWADYVDVNSNADKYYDTSDFAEIILSDKLNHPGSNDCREAFRGYASATVLNPAYYTGDMVSSIDNEARAEMKRPMGKFKFVSTDVDVFLARMVQMMKEKGMLKDFEYDPDNSASSESVSKSIALSDFTVLFRYKLFMPCSFNMFTDKPAYAWKGMSFKSKMFTDDYKEMTLGFDYIFVNGSETTLSISVEVYSADGELMSSTNPIDVPIVRNKLTIVKGDFLTSKASEGITISPEFDGEHNIEIK